MIFTGDITRKPFKIKGSTARQMQYQIKEFTNTNDVLRLIDLRTGKKATNETFFYLLGREIEIEEDEIEP